MPLATVEKVLGLYREKYPDFNVAHFVEKLQREREEGIDLGDSWVKKALQEAGLVARQRRRGTYRKRRPRRPLKGMLLQAAACNLALILRQMLGAGTPRGLQDRLVELFLTLFRIVTLGKVRMEGRARRNYPTPKVEPIPLLRPGATLPVVAQKGWFRHSLLGYCQAYPLVRSGSVSGKGVLRPSGRRGSIGNR